MYPQKPEELTPQQQEATDPADKLYGDPSKLFGSIDQSELMDVAELPEGEREAAAAEMRDNFHALGLSGPEAQEATALLTQAYREMPTDEQVQAWEQQTLAEVRPQFGQDWEGDLALARKFVAQHKDVHDTLHQTGLGNHPKIVRWAIGAARRAAVSGKLK